MSDFQLAQNDATLPRHDRSSRGLASLLGRNEQMREVRQLIERVADTDATVLIAGESGTGKGLVARDIHAASPRRDRPFVKVNCAALPSELLESELFGFERGAFTGAVQHRPGKFEFAHQGTMFLDEISELTLGLQSKLLQVLQDGEFSRLGGRDDVHVDVRVVAATNQDLERAVVERTFREDLFFRLNVVALELPPLRQRSEDIYPLSMKALLHYGKEFGKEVTEIDAEARGLLERYYYPGNIRELQNIIERATIFCTGRTLTASSLPRELRDQTKQTTMTVTQGDGQVIRVEMQVGKHTLAEIEDSIIEEALRLADYNKSLAAKQLGLTRFALDRRLKKIHRDD